MNASRLRSSLLAALIACALPGLASAAPLALGSKAPSADVKMKGVDGRELSIADAKGKKGTLVIFTCNHCPYVKAWDTRIAALGNEFSKKGVGVIAINSNDPAVQAEDGFSQMQERSKKLGLAYPYVVDATSDVARAFGATRTPEIFLFDATGALVYHGAVDDNSRDPEKVRKRWLRDALEALVAGEPPPVAQTKAFGCTIKFRDAN